MVVCHKGADEETTISGSVQEYVVRLLPETEQAWDLLLQWMTADSKTADDGTLRAMWEKWQSMNTREVPLKDRAFFEAAAKNTAVAEAWCLSPFKPSLSDQVPEAMRGFERTVWSQVFSEDDRVRRSIIACLLNGSAYWPHKPSGFLRGLDAPVSVREQAAAEAREIYLHLRQSREYAESEELTSQLEKRFEALNAALQPQ